MTRIGIVAAFPGELAPLVRSWLKSGSIYTGRIGSREAVATCAGMGAASAMRACESLLSAAPPDKPIDTLVSIGWAGSLSCGLKPPDVCAVREVVDAATGERFAAASGSGQRLITLDHVADPPEKRLLAETWQSVLVDMEAAAVARFARAHNLGFLCFKAVTDGPSDRLPNFNRFTGPDGRLRLPALVVHALAHPQTWGPLRRLGKNSRLAAIELSQFLSRSLAASQ